LSEPASQILQPLQVLLVELLQKGFEAEQSGTDLRQPDVVPVLSDHFSNLVLGDLEQSCDARDRLGRGWPDTHPAWTSPRPIARNEVN
jgi:hypothetical protein